MTIAIDNSICFLGVVYEHKVRAFEKDPCGLVEIYGMRGWNGQKYARGVCTQPNQCTCLCKERYDRKKCRRNEKNCNGPWQDPMVNLRDVLNGKGAEFTFGSTDCEYGYEGNVDEYDRFTTCHQTIYVPTETERISVELIISISVIGFSLCVIYYFVSERVRKRYQLAQIEKRRMKRAEEDAIAMGEPIPTQRNENESRLFKRFW
jgi:hypothetical protein